MSDIDWTQPHIFVSNGRWDICLEGDCNRGQQDPIHQLGHVIEITPERDRRVREERRREPRERIADMEKRLARIVEIFNVEGGPNALITHYDEIYRLARGVPR